jgi:pimeloyl-ACP methyl ester carboxylesterase
MDSAATTEPARLAYREAGRADAPVLVLLHGFGGSGRSFDAIIDDLAGSARLIMPDLPGHGGSRDVADGGRPKSVADLVLATLEDAGIAGFHLCGFSLGGAVATLMTLTAPDRVRSLTLLAPGGYGPEIASGALEALAAARTAEDLRESCRAMFAPGGEPPDADIAQLVEERREENATAELVAISQRIARDGRQGEIPRSAIETLKCPVTVVWGTADPVLPVSHAKNLPPDFKVRLVPGAGHFLVHEAQQDVVQALLDTMAAASGNASR